MDYTIRERLVGMQIMYTLRLGVHSKMKLVNLTEILVTVIQCKLKYLCKVMLSCLSYKGVAQIFMRE